MGVVPLTPRRFTVAEYLTIERQASTRSEYLDGGIYAIAGASPAHVTITFNLAGEIHAQLKGGPCQGMSVDMKVRTSAQDLFSYPDILIVCGTPRYHDEHQDVLLNPVAIIEVLPSSTEEYDRTTKFDRYRSIETLVDYVMIAQDMPRVELHSRQTHGRWAQKVVDGIEEVLKLTCVPISLPLRDVYDRLTFEAVGHL